MGVLTKRRYYSTERNLYIIILDSHRTVDGLWYYFSHAHIHILACYLFNENIVFLFRKNVTVYNNTYYTYNTHIYTNIHNYYKYNILGCSHSHNPCLDHQGLSYRYRPPCGRDRWCCCVVCLSLNLDCCPLSRYREEILLSICSWP